VSVQTVREALKEKTVARGERGHGLIAEARWSCENKQSVEDEGAEGAERADTSGLRENAWRRGE